jgi:hypothetical protein
MPAPLEEFILLFEKACDVCGIEREHKDGKTYLVDVSLVDSQRAEQGFRAAVAAIGTNGVACILSYEASQEGLDASFRLWTRAIWRGR